MKRISPLMLVALVGLALLAVLQCATAQAKPTMTFRATAESQVLVLINAERAKHNLRPLTLDAKLTAAARSHSADMIANGYFEHNGPSQTWDARVRSFTGQRALLAENIALGSGSYGTPAGLVRSWMHSPPHRANILRIGVRRIGVGIALGTYDGYAATSMATTDFSS